MHAVQSAAGTAVAFADLPLLLRELRQDPRDQGGRGREIGGDHHRAGVENSQAKHGVGAQRLAEDEGNHRGGPEESAGTEETTPTGKGGYQLLEGPQKIAG